MNINFSGLSAQTQIQFAGSKEDVDKAVRRYQAEQKLPDWADPNNSYLGEKDRPNPSEINYLLYNNKPNEIITPIDDLILNKPYSKENFNPKETPVHDLKMTPEMLRAFELAELKALEKLMAKAEEEGVDALNIIEAGKVADAVAAGKFSSLEELREKIAELEDPQDAPMIDSLISRFEELVKPVLSPAQQVVQAVLDNDGAVDDKTQNNEKK